MKDVIDATGDVNDATTKKKRLNRCLPMLAEAIENWCSLDVVASRKGLHWVYGPESVPPGIAVSCGNALARRRLAGDQCQRLWQWHCANADSGRAAEQAGQTSDLDPSRNVYLHAGIEGIRMLMPQRGCLYHDRSSGLASHRMPEMIPRPREPAGALHEAGG